jgi:galactose mutarotase-like enzyme
MIKVIQNEHLIVDINSLGAEVFSIKSKNSNTEFLWQGDEKYWSGKAPVLFPICGRLFEGKYVYKDKEYEMELHGFARKSEFSVNEISSNEIEFILVSNEQTRKIYPFDFELKITFRLEDNKLVKTMKVKNTGNSVMPFSFGGHPGFNVPVYDGEAFEDYYVEFPNESLDKIVMSDRCLYLNKTEKYLLVDKRIPLRHDLFDNDALFFEMKDASVKLKSRKSSFELEFSFNDMTCLGLWHMPKTDAPYICIEPWHGVPADDGVVDNTNDLRK